MPWQTRFAHASAAILLATALWPGRSIAAPPLNFDIPRGTLSDALAIYARQSGRQLLFAPTDVASKHAAPVHGRLDPDRALARLLAGTGFRARAAPGGAILLEPAPVARPALRLDPAEPDAIAPADVAKAPDIVVVGTPGGGSRRQEAAFAVTSIDRAAIDRLAPASTADVLRLVPGLTIESSGGKNGANIFVRGYPSGGDAEYVTFQTEGVPFFPPATLSFLENSQLYRIDETVQRVEAVRGGTSALFASGQPGVTVNLVLREGGDHLEGVAKLGVITDGEVRGDALLSGPLGADTRFMIGGYYSRGDGIRSPDFDADRGGQITANLRHDFGKGSVLVFTRYLNDRSQWLLPIPVEQNGRRISAYPGFDAGSGTLAGPDTRIGTLNDGRRYDLEDGRGARIVNLGANLEGDLGGGFTVRDKFSWLAGHADTTGLVSGDVAPESAAAYAAKLGSTIASLTTVSDGRAVSPDQAIVEAGVWSIRKRVFALVNDATLEWKAGPSKATVGIYATRYGSRDYWNTGNDLLLTATPNAERLNMTLANGDVVTRDGFTSGASFLVNAHYTGTDLAFYGVEELKLNDRVRIDAGIRHQHHSVDGTIADNDSTGPGGLDGNPLTLYDNDDVVLSGTNSRLRYRGGAWSWTIGANVDITRALGAFARFSHGNSFPFFDNLRDGIDVAPQVDTVEGGIKLSTRPLSLYATLFHNNFRGLATTVITDGAPLASIGGARATGVELEGVWRPKKPISVTFSGTWLDAHYRHFYTDDGLTDLTGNRVQRQPEWQWRVTPAWDFTIGGRKASLSTTISYMGDRWSDVQNAQLLPRFWKWDAGLSLDMTPRLRLQATADNITNAIGLTEGNPRMLGAQGTGAIFARPILGRSVELSARYGF
ncbi:TonB-dependent receptor [Sphingomonas sp. CGMCC 1.13654]|uniref:TonB-dependent receptor n=1 Tax=Sphingomonas chungangi TaxID=2683589 RepID=A0A838L3E5_9SPHN|nr:TonB-dependent receptor [Sphingomonas chungangi]MVW57749.1 TonB-dependent receptor plug domain-containing protein [Sphingomonas chungangi]